MEKSGGVRAALHHPAGLTNPASWDTDFGYLIKSYSNLADPTTINVRIWSCQSNLEPQPGQGAGSLLMAWFAQQNG